MYPAVDYNHARPVGAVFQDPDRRSSDVSLGGAYRDREEPFFDALGRVAAEEVTGGSG